MTVYYASILQYNVSCQMIILFSSARWVSSIESLESVQIFWRVNPCAHGIFTHVSRA
jgi:hypothetical protein